MIIYVYIHINMYVCVYIYYITSTCTGPNPYLPTEIVSFHDSVHGSLNQYLRGQRCPPPGPSLGDPRKNWMC